MVGRGSLIYGSTTDGRTGRPPVKMAWWWWWCGGGAECNIQAREVFLIFTRGRGPWLHTCIQNLIATTVYYNVAIYGLNHRCEFHELCQVFHVNVSYDFFSFHLNQFRLQISITPPVLPSVTKFIYFQIRISWTWGVPEMEIGPLKVFCREKYYPTC